MSTSDTRDAADNTRICPKCEAGYGADVERCPADGARLLFPREEPDQFLGRTLDGRFRIDARIGGGAMGTVYRAWQISVQREVAVKIMNSRVGATTMGVRRFLREARLASKLAQPNTVSVLDFGQTREGDLFLVMELLEGRTLFELVRDQGAFEVDRVVRIGAQLCDALERAHGQSIVHRDLKPSNVLVLADPPGRDMIKVLDFGLAKSIEGDETEATMTGQVVGTPRYIAPEIWLGGEATARSDLYALGMILGEMALGRALFQTPRGAAQLAERIADARRELPAALGAPLRPLIEQLLAPEPRDRPHSAAAVRAELMNCLGASSSVLSAWSTAVPDDASPSGTEQLTPFDAQGETTTVDARPPRIVAGGPRRRVWAALAVAAMVGVAAAVLAMRGSGDTGAPRPAAEAVSQPAAQAAASARPPAAEETAAALPAPADASAPGPDAAVKVEETVELDLRSTPRARVRVGGRAVGRTPVKVRVARGTGEVEVRFERRGSRTVRKRVVPDRDHSIDVSLSRARKRPKKAKPQYPF